MRHGKFKLGKYDIDPTTKADMLQGDEFNVIKIENGTVYISKTPLGLCGSKFWVSIYFEEIFIRKIELSNADEKYKMNYQTMDSAILESLKKENDEFLLNNLGHSYKENISGREYEYSWGKIRSYLDLKSAEAGIVINIG